MTAGSSAAWRGAQGRTARTAVSTAALLVAMLAVAAVPAPIARAACTPAAYPNDPGYAPADRGVSGATWDGGQWYLYGCMPSSAPLATDAENASGMSVDRVWNELGNRGRDDVKVAYMEGGVNWRISSSCELKDRAWLNTGELPYPRDAREATASTWARQGIPMTSTATAWSTSRTTSTTPASRPPRWACTAAPATSPSPSCTRCARGPQSAPTSPPRT